MALAALATSVVSEIKEAKDKATKVDSVVKAISEDLEVKARTTEMALISTSKTYLEDSVEILVVKEDKAKEIYSETFSEVLGKEDKEELVRVIRLQTLEETMGNPIRLVLEEMVMAELAASDSLEICFLVSEVREKETLPVGI